MTSIELLKQDLDAELKLGTKMVVNWDMYIEMHNQEIVTAYEEGYNRAAKVIEDAVQRNILKDKL
jgi:hypothetical protein